MKHSIDNSDTIFDIRKKFNRVITVQKDLNNKNIKDFIDECSIIFSLKEKKEPHFLFDFFSVRQCSMLGVLITYKILDFAFRNRCFYQPYAILSPSLLESLEKYKFKELIWAMLQDNQSVKALFSTLKTSITNDFIIAPQPLLNNDKYTSDKLNKQIVPKIENYYSFNQDFLSIILNCFGEVFLNFWEHAIDESNSIILAYGNKSQIEIACADNGEGIISTLSKSLSPAAQKDPLKIFLSSLHKGVTSKKNSNHMGHGLWIIDEIVKKTKGRLKVYSEGFFYHREFNGKTDSGLCGYWKGTIVYICIPIGTPVKLSDIETISNTSTKNIKIKWS